MRAIQTIASSVVGLVLTVFTCASQDFFDVAKASSDLYDNRGFLKGKATNWQGNVNVSMTNGNVQYRYDLSNTTYSGIPINVSLNYNQNASYTSYLKFIPTNPNSQQSGKYVTFTQNRPLWTVGVNGFAVQALHAARMPIQAKAVRNAAAGLTNAVDDLGLDNNQLTDEHVTWLLDGYDVCNMTSDLFNPSHKVTDVIRILREDGSIMELVQTSGKYCGPDVPTSDVVTGVYMEKAANSRAYAVVTYDTDKQFELKSYADYLDTYVQVDKERDLYRPRRCTYYPGDGTAYVFMEWRTPFGLRPIKQMPLDGNLPDYETGDWRGSMSVFYLERIEQFGQTVIEFERSKHKNLVTGHGDYGVPLLGEDVSPGRATFLGFEGHQFFWSDQGCKINVDGKITEVTFDNVIKSGRGSDARKLIPYCPVGSQGDPLTVEPQWLEEQDEFMSYVGLVTSIIDPVGRITSFDYESTSRTILNTSYPFGKTSAEQPEFSLKLKGKRLTKVTEYDKKTDISYSNPADCQPFEYASLSSTNGSPDPRSVQIAQSVTVSNSSNLPQHQTVYAIGSGSTFSPGQDRLVSSADHWDLIEDPNKTNSTGKTSETYEYKSLDPLYGQNLSEDVNVGRFTELTRRVNVADGVTTTTHRTYTQLTDGTNASYIFMPSEELTTKTIGAGPNAVPINEMKKTYSYEVENVYDGVVGLAAMNSAYVHAFGLRPTKQSELLSVGNGSTFTDNVLTETYYRNDKSTTTSFTYNRKDWFKHASIEEFLNAVEQGTAKGEDWDKAKGDEPWMVYGINTITEDIQKTPRWGVVTKTLVIDPVSLLIHSGTEYEFNESPFSQTGFYDFAYLKPVRTYRLLPLGRRELLSEVIYGSDLNRSFIEKSTDAVGATTSYFRNSCTVPSGRTDVSYDGKRDVSILTDNPNSREVKTQQLDFFTKHARFFETPYATQQIIRKANPAAPLGPLTKDVLCTHNRIGVNGVVTDAVDDNGWLTSSTHDDMGRVRVLWMPGDFMSENWDPQLNGESLALIGADTRRVDGYPMAQRTLYSYLYVCPQVPGDEEIQVPFKNEVTFVNDTYVGWQVMEPPIDKCASTTRIAPRDPSDAPKKGASEQTTQQYIGGVPPDGWAPDPMLYFKKKYLSIVSIDIPRWEYKTVTSAKLHVKVANVVGNSVGVTFKFKDHNTFVENMFGADAVSTTVTPSDVTEYIVDLVADLDAFQASTGTGPQLTRFTFSFSPEEIAENEAKETAYIQIVSAQLVVTGEFRKWENFSSLSDFTLAFGVDDKNRYANRFVKIDDSRSRVVPYPSGYTLPWRLAPSYTKLGVDDATLEERTNYPIRTLNPHGTTAGSTTAFAYNGKGNTKTVTDPDGNVTTFTFDAQGRPRTTNYPTYDLSSSGSGCFQFLQANSQKIEQSFAIEQRSTTLFPDNYQRNDIYGRDDLSSGALLSLTTSTNEVGKKSLQVTDALGRLRRTVENYNESSYPTNPFQDPNRVENLTTMFDYDIFGRVVRVTNPKGQQTLYWYNFYNGKVLYSFQPDVGAVSYAYDMLGHVRFSQNDAQEAENKLSFFQYDDLGRISAVGEATINPATMRNVVSVRSQAASTYSWSFYADRFTDQIDPNVLAISQTASGQDLKLVTVNRTLWQQPVSAVPKVWNNGAEAIVAACPPLLIAGNDTKFNPRVVPGLDDNVLLHPAIKYNRVPHVSSPDDFEDAQAHPSNYITVVQYDALPPSLGVAWGGFPAASTWNAISASPTNAVRNLRGRIASIAYRGHGFQPFHYVVKSYDERGRLEALLRFTENVGFDAVYYSYNSMNAVTRIRVVDPLKQHYTWYTYDDQGRQNTMRSTIVNGGFGVGAQPVLPMDVTTIPVNAFTNEVMPSDEQYAYNKRNELVNTVLTGPQKRIDRTYNTRGWLTSITSKDVIPVFSDPPEFQQFLNYSATGLITSQCWTRGLASFFELYDYDDLHRLTAYNGSNGTNTYTYDAVGNRTKDHTGGTERSYSHVSDIPQPNTQYPPNALYSVTNATHNAQFTYDAHGALTLRSIKESTALTATSKIEEFSYDASGLIERYQVRKAAGPGGQSTECAPDASLSPRSDWRYRFGPMKEREQKRLYLSDEGPAASLPWVYYLLSPNKQQLAVYNGIEGKPCGGAIGNVYMWPVEYNAYGVGGGRVITRPDNTKRFVVTDHLGSVRLTYDAQGGVLETADYEPFGALVTKTGEEARTGYIGRETDNESNLGFNGVRLYDQQYGRFLSTDAMWEKNSSLASYSYCANRPTSLIDFSGNDSTKVASVVIPITAVGWHIISNLIDESLTTIATAGGYAAKAAGIVGMILVSPISTGTYDVMTTTLPGATTRVAPGDQMSSTSPKSVEERAKDIHDQIGKNRLTVPGVGHVDVVGDGHYVKGKGNVANPHTHVEETNYDKNGKAHRKFKKDPIPTTHDDLDAAQKHIDSQKSTSKGSTTK